METDDFKNQLNTIDPTGKGQLNLSYTDADGNVHTVTLRYNGATVSAPQPGTPDSSKDTETRKDVTDNVITGTAYVTGSNTWTESGSLNGTYVKPGSGELPSLDGWTIASKDPEKGTTTYKKEDTVTSPDGTSTKITRTCTITESSASLSDTEKEEIAWAELLNQHPEYKNKDELKAAGYNINISSMDFSGIKRVEWTIDELSESTKTDAKDLNDKLVIPGGKNWSIDEKAGTITVDGKAVDFAYVGNDAVIPRSSLSDVCQVRIVADNGNGGYKTAAVWYNKDYGNELTFGADYGAYTDCDATGLAKPGDKVVDVLTWAFYRSFQEAINEGNSSLLRYSTAGNSTRCAAEIRNYTGNTYDLGNFQAVSDPASIKYTDGQVIYNGHFVANYTDSGSSYTADHHRTLRLVWEDGIWKVDAFSLLPDGAYSATTYATLP